MIIGMRLLLTIFKVYDRRWSLSLYLINGEILGDIGILQLSSK